MSTCNVGWRPEHDAAPTCDTCGALCERGYRWFAKDDGEVTRVLCFDCADTEDLGTWRKTGKLSTRFMLTATLRDYKNDPRYLKPADQIRDVQLAIKAFAVRCWQSVSDTIDAEKKAAGMSVRRADGLVVRSFVSAGRVLLHVERGDVWCCAIGEEGNPSRGLGLQGIGATSAEAISLWHDAEALFANGATIAADRHVAIG